jgi:hypothetical protein
LDPCGESEEDYHEEQKIYRKALRSQSFDSEDNEFPHFGEFRGDGIKTELKKRALEKLEQKRNFKKAALEKMEKGDLETSSAQGDLEPSSHGLASSHGRPSSYGTPDVDTFKQA